MVMITKRDIEYSVFVRGEKLFVYKNKRYRPIKVLFNSHEAIQYAKNHIDMLIVSVVDKERKKWLIMKKV